MVGLGNMGLFGSFIKEGWEKAFRVAKFFCFLHVTNTYLISPVMVSMITACTFLKFIFMINNWPVLMLQTYGPSMLPTMDLIPSLYLAERISARFGKVDRGDIVVMRSPQNPRKTIAKRMVGIEGDSVTYVISPKISDKRETVVVWSPYLKNK